MKKLINLLTITTLASSGVIGATGNYWIPKLTQSIQFSKKKNKNLNVEADNPFITKNASFPATNGATCMLQASNGTIYAGEAVYNNALFQSTDNGKTWTKNTVFGSQKQVFSIFQALNGTIYVGTGSQGIWQSTDNGKTWTQNASFPATNGVFSIFQASNGTIYVGTGFNGLFQSTDNGKTFTKISSIPTNSVIRSIFQASDDTIYVGSSNLFQSTDNGKTWTKNTTFGLALGVLSIYQTFNETIYVGTYTQGLFQSTDNGKTWTRNLFLTSKIEGINFITQSANGILYVIVGTGNTGLYQSTDNGQSFVQITSLPDSYTGWVMLQASNGTIYVPTNTQGLYQINFDLLYDLSLNNSYLNSGDYLTYKTTQNISLKNQYLQSATLDGSSITVPSTKQLTVGKHTIDLTLKSDYWKYASLFGGNNINGEISLNIWIKTSIDKSLISYSTESDSNLLTGLTSNLGNTKGYSVIQTEAKSGTHTADLTYTNSSKMINYQKSYYVKGNINTTTNDFTASGTNTPLNNNFQITTDGIYHLYLVDYDGNTYNAILELGKTNFKTKGSINKQDITDKADALNVKDELTDPTDVVLQQFSGWLDNYQSQVIKTITNTFNDLVKSQGKGFDYNSVLTSALKEQKNWLGSVTYSDPANPPAHDINQLKMTQDITTLINNLTNKDITDGVDNLKMIATKLHIQGQSNIKNKSDLDKYSSFVNNYNSYLNENFLVWQTKAITTASKGYLTAAQIKTLETKYSITNFELDYLKTVNWTPKLNPTPYDNYIELTKFDNAVKSFVETTYKVNEKLNQDIANAEKGVNLHGHSVSDILKYGNKQLPENKTQISNFDGKGTSFHNWLQKTSNDYNKSLNTKNNTKTIIFSVVFGVLGILIIAYVIWRLRYRFSMKLSKKPSKITKENKKDK